MSTGSLEQALSTGRVIVCVGAGGVGKTTVAASLGLQAAMQGRSALVCTIDPARRLANALGVSELGNAETEIAKTHLEAAGVTLRAPLFAMMLDLKKSWDAVIPRHTTPEQRDTILSNRFYQSLSSRLAGSHEYIAMEKLWELRMERQYDLIVLDTPPTAHALDFLDAPKRILDFFDNEAARWLLTPALKAGRMGLRFLNFGNSLLTSTISKLTGTQTLQELAELLLATQSLHETFRKRASEVRSLLSSADSSFVVVTGPMPERLDETLHFHRVLSEAKIEVAAVVANRVHAAPTPAERTAAELAPSPTRERLTQTLRELTSIAREDARGLTELKARLPGTPLVEIPRFMEDIHDLAGLARTAAALRSSAGAGLHFVPGNQNP